MKNNIKSLVEILDSMKEFKSKDSYQDNIELVNEYTGLVKKYGREYAIAVVNEKYNDGMYIKKRK